MSAPPSQNPVNNCTGFSDFFSSCVISGFFCFWCKISDVKVYLPRETGVDGLGIEAAAESWIGRDLVLVLTVNKQI